MLNRRRLLVPFAVLATVVTLLIPLVPSTSARADTILGNATPGELTDSDRSWVELGVRFSASVDGTVTGIRFYKGPDNRGTHAGSLWSADGRRLAQLTFGNESRSGWQSAAFASPIKIERGKTYVASYTAPAGAYSADNHGYDRPLRAGYLAVPAGGGVFSYTRGTFPQNTWLNSNYYVDVIFKPGTTSETASSSPSTGAGAPSGPSNASTSAPANAGSVGGSQTLNLPRIPWEGGASYWTRFPKTAAAGWDNPGFFPIGLWWGGFSTNAEVQYDKSVGINTYILLNESTDYQLLANNNMFFIGGKLNAGFTNSSRQWVGDFLDDEVDGRFTPAEGRAHLQQLSDATKGDGRFRYANFTQTVATSDMMASDADAYVNNYTDAVSIDQYFYTIPYCDWRPYRDAYIVGVNEANCRTASSYGKIVQALRQRDASDGKLQAPWQFVEIMSPEDPATHAGYHATNGDKVAGATMNSIINEARGIVYFNQTFSGSCGSGNLVRLSMQASGRCASDSVAGVKRVTSQIRQLAPVINTQSYAYSFGAGLNTMLKADDGSIYIFAMIDGSSSPGSRTFTLPSGVGGTSAQVMFENRSVPISGGKFTDSFSTESTYHIYKITR